MAPVALRNRTPSPAFQFYPREFMLSPKVMGMSATERGVYITLLCVQWLDGSLPTDFAELAPIVKVKAPQLARMWPTYLAKCFIERNGRYINDKLEKVRRDQIDYRRRQSDKGKLGGRPPLAKRSRAKANPLPTQSSVPATASVSEKNNQKTEEGTAVALTFKTDGEPTEFVLYQSRIGEWQGSYPNLDVLAECRKASVWLNANPEKRKTASGMPRFLVNWLNNAVNRGQRSAAVTAGRGVTGAPPAGKYDGMEEHD